MIGNRTEREDDGNTIVSSVTHFQSLTETICEYEYFVLKLQMLCVFIQIKTPRRRPPPSSVHRLRLQVSRDLLLPSITVRE